MGESPSGENDDPRGDPFVKMIAAVEKEMRLKRVIE